MSFDFLQDKNKKVHFIGIGGISMSGLAEILLKNCYRVSGSDRSESSIIKKLEKKGAEIYIGHSADNIKDVDLVVYTAAIPSDNPEILKSKSLNIPLMDRAEFLGQIMKGHKYNVAISGTHGKTTTTSMFSHIALAADLDPTILVGGELEALHGNVRAGNSEYFITEACEYKASFLKFYPSIGVILNIEADHLDFYKDLQQIQDTFFAFTNLIPQDGYLIANFDDPIVKSISAKVTCNILSFGINDGLIRAKNISFNNNGCGAFDVYKNEEKLFSVKLKVPGTHNISNSLAAICTALSLNLSYEYIVKGIESFGGTHRRFEIKGTKDGITVIDDYAHHPTEIKATLDAAKKCPHNKIYCVFQPHTYTRTLTLFDEFSESFYDSDTLVLADIYPAREKDPGTVTSKMLCDTIKENGVKCISMSSFENIVEYLQNNMNPGDLLLTLGAGDVYKIGELFLK